MNDRIVLSVVFARLFDGCDSQLQSNEPEGLARRDRIALLRQWGILSLKIEGVQVVVVQEADDPRPRASHAVRVECFELRMEHWCKCYGYESVAVAQRLRYEAVLCDTLERFVP